MRNPFDLRTLPYLPETVQSMEVSSHSRKGENHDWGMFLYTDDNGEDVLFDEKGTGVIRGFWATNLTEDTILHFYFDGHKKADIEISIKDFFKRKHPLFNTHGNTFQLRGHYSEAECYAGNCFIPIPYEKSLKITSTGNKEYYYHILYERLPVGTELPKMDGTVPEEFKFAFTGCSIKKANAERTVEAHITTKEFCTEIFKQDTAGMLTEIKLAMPMDTDIKNLWIEMRWDDNIFPQVYAPISHMFLMPLGYTDVFTYAAKTYLLDGKMMLHLYLPMPFWKNASIKLLNRTGKELTVDAYFGISENQYGEEEAGYFNAQYREGLTENYKDWELMRNYGRGTVVGVVQTCSGTAPGGEFTGKVEHYCEGDERIYINGSRSPQLNGTGTEDFYLACFWPNFKFDSPCSGCVNDVYLMNNATMEGTYKYPAGFYRFFFDMPISFHNGIDMRIQHGDRSNIHSEYSSLVTYYCKPEPAFEQTDYISVGNDVSKAMHNYKATAAESYAITSAFEGEDRFPRTERKGNLHNGGTVEFEVALNPENKGMCLRRLLSQAVSPQGGKVYVDGEYAVEWYDSELNEFLSFSDSDIWIPAVLTEGKDKVTVKIEIEKKFSDFEYIVYSIIK